MLKLPGTIKPDLTVTQVCNCICDCSDSCECTQVIQKKTGNAYIYPNPTSDILRFSKTYSRADITIYSADGKFVDWITPFNGNAIDVKQYGPGSFVLSIDEETFYFVVQ
jgi:hypothetical protein